MEQREESPYVDYITGERFQIPERTNFDLTIKPAGTVVPKLIGLIALGAVAVYATPLLSLLSLGGRSSGTGFDGLTKSSSRTDTARINARSTLREAGQRISNGGSYEDAMLFEQLQSRMDILDQSGGDPQAYQSIVETAATLATDGKIDANMW